MRRHLLLLVGLLATPLLPGCGRGGDATGLRDDQFVEVMVQLRVAADRTRAEPDSFPAVRDRILRDAGVTEEQLLAYIERHGTDLAHMAEVWQSINQRLSDPEQ